MTSEPDAEFVERMEDTKRELGTLETDDWPRLFALARRGAAAWRPISEAPKDGVPLLMLYPDTAEKMAVMWWDVDWKEWRGYYDGIGPSYEPPTHWMPLPPPAGEPRDE